MRRLGCNHAVRLCNTVSGVARISVVMPFVVASGRLAVSMAGWPTLLMPPSCPRRQTGGQELRRPAEQHCVCPEADRHDAQGCKIRVPTGCSARIMSPSSSPRDSGWPTIVPPSCSALLMPRLFGTRLRVTKNCVGGAVQYCVAARQPAQFGSHSAPPSLRVCALAHLMRDGDR